MVSDKKTLLAEANASAKCNLISVGGCVDTPVHVDGTGNTDGKRPYLGNRQTVLMRDTLPNQTPEFVECGSDVIIKNCLPPILVDDALFRKVLITNFSHGPSSRARARELLLE